MFIFDDNENTVRFESDLDDDDNDLNQYYDDDEDGLTDYAGVDEDTILNDPANQEDEEGFSYFARDESGKRKKITIDQDELDEALFGDSNDPDNFLTDDDSDADLDQQVNERTKVMGAEIKQAIQNLRVPEDFIPEDFNPNDREQVQQMFSRSIQIAVQQALPLMMKPVQFTVQQLEQRTNRSMERSIRNSQRERTTQDTLEERIPLISDRKYKAVIEPMFKTQLTRFDGDRAAAIKATRSGLTAMGLDPDNKAARQRTSSGSKSTSSILDEFAPLQSSRGKPRSRASRHMRRG